MALYPPLLRLPVFLAVLREFLPTYFGGLSSSFGTFLDELWAAITSLSPLGVADALVRFLTRLPYQTIIAIVNSLGKVLAANAQYYRRYVVKGDDVVRFMVKLNTETFLQAGQLGSSDLFDYVLGFLAQIGWSIATRSSIVDKILKLMKINSYENLLVYFKSSALKTLWLSVARFFLAYFALGFAMISLTVLGAFYHKWFEEYALAQDSARVWRKRGGQHRMNRRRGKDA